MFCYGFKHNNYYDIIILPKPRKRTYYMITLANVTTIRCYTTKWCARRKLIAEIAPFLEITLIWITNYCYEYLQKNKSALCKQVMAIISCNLPYVVSTVESIWRLRECTSLLGHSCLLGMWIIKYYYSSSNIGKYYPRILFHPLTVNLKQLVPSAIYTFDSLRTITSFVLSWLYII